MPTKLTENIIRHIDEGGKATVKFFRDDTKLFAIHSKFWTAYLHHVRNHPVVHMVQGFHSKSLNDYILIEAFDDAGDRELESLYDAGVVLKIEQRVLTSEEIRMKRNGVRAVGNYALPGCRLTSTQEFDRYISNVRAGSYIPIDVGIIEKKWWEFWK